MKLWVANTTKKNIHFPYRVPENPRLLDIVIPYGTQVVMYKPDITQAECDAIVNQLQRKLNAVEAGSRPSGYVGVCYSINKDVKEEVVLAAIEANDDILTAQGEQLRQDSAVAVHETMASASADPTNLRKTVVEIKEEVPPDREAQVDHTTQVFRDGESGSDKPQVSRRKRK